IWEIKRVSHIDSEDKPHLSLLGRPELGRTLTKIHVWSLWEESIGKVVFLDADMLVLKGIDELFDRPEFAAAPDAGWPDCFNSGLFVAVPSAATHSSLLGFARQNGSFDGTHPLSYLFRRRSGTF